MAEANGGVVLVLVRLWKLAVPWMVGDAHLDPCAIIPRGALLISKSAEGSTGPVTCSDV